MFTDCSADNETVVLDLANACVWRDGQRWSLRGKDEAVLCLLAAHPGEVVRKATLIESVWGDTVVAEAVIKDCIARLRRALGDTARSPRFIETVYGQGYRLLQALPLQPEAAASDVRPVPPAWLVGRDTALRQLHAWLAATHQGEGRLGLIAGEVGIGKTTVVEAFLAEIAGRQNVQVLWGQCIEHYGPGEAYLPLFEALQQACRGPHRERYIAVLRQLAPTWLIHLPGLLDAAEYVLLQRQTAGTTQTGMLRELHAALTALAADTPLLLILEDLHWSDTATLELLSALVQRRAPARWLVVGTYRPEAVSSANNPLQALLQTWHHTSHVADLQLTLLSEADVMAYLDARFAPHALPSYLATVLHRRTEGNPLFLVTTVDQLVAQEVVAQEVVAQEVVAQTGDVWNARADWQAALETVQPTLQRLVLQRQALCQADEQRVLAAASVAGLTFSAAAVAAGLDADLAVTAACCEALAQRGILRKAQGKVTWPDGTVAPGYGFRHALYQQVLYEQVPAAQRAQLHRRIAAREEQGYGEQASMIASRLALHFERGRDVPRAVHYHQQAAQHATQLCGFQEAIGHLTTALELLPQLPDDPERTACEMALYHLLGMALAATRGFAAPEVEQAYARARKLGLQLRAPLPTFSVLLGLWAFYSLRGDLQTSRQLAEHLLSLAQQAGDPFVCRRGHMAMGVELVYHGEMRPALTHLEAGIAQDDRQHALHAAFSGHPEPSVVCLAYTAWALWLLGYPGQAVRKCWQALARARQLGHALSQAHALAFAANLYVFRRQPARVRAYARAVLRLAAEHGFGHYGAMATVLDGWALAQQDAAAGFARMQQGITAWQAVGAELSQPFWFALLAEAAAASGQTASGLSLIAKALASVQRGGGNWWEAEIYRLRGDLLLNVEYKTQNVEWTPEDCYQTALSIARRQQAKSLELRAAVSLARLWQQLGKVAEAGDLLAPVYGWFSEGFETAVMQDARALLTGLA